MKVAVLGAGVVGLTTAAWLAEAGHDVIIIDQSARPGSGTSFGNGAQLSYSHVTPLATPDTLRRLPSLLLAANAPLTIRPSIDPAFIRWGLSFIASCTSRQVERTKTAMAALAELSRVELERLLARAPLSFGHAEAGKLVLYRSTASFAAARAAFANRKADAPLAHLLGPREVVELEPALRVSQNDIAGGVFTPSDQVGDCAAFCAALAEQLRLTNRAAFALNTAVIAPVLRKGRLAAVATTAGDIAADAFVLSLGSAAPRFARAAGFRLPVLPIKGYSLTLNQPPATRGLAVSVTDHDNRIVLAPITVAGRKVVRVAGMADLAGDDLTLRPQRIALLRKLSDSLIETSRDGDDAAWTGLRPATPHGRPIIGPSPLPGLYLNTGHGFLGWTLAAGSARLLSDLLAGRPPAIDPAPFAFR